MMSFNAKLRMILAQEGLIRVAAGRPYMPEVTLKKYRDGEAFMAYMIDAARNKSKFYEMAVVPDNYGAYTLKKLWGALGPTGHKAKKEVGLEYDEALRLLKRHGRGKLRKGYQDAFKSRPLGQYPVGLDRNVGFGWSTQGIVQCVPALRNMVGLINMAMDEATAGDAPDLLRVLEDMTATLGDIPDSSMAKEIAKLMRGPLQRMKKNPRFVDDPARTKKELASLGKYINLQLRECNV